MPYCCATTCSEHGWQGLPSSRLTRPDQRRGDINRIVVSAGEIIDGPQYRIVKTVAQIGDFGELYEPTSEIRGALLEDPL